MGDGTAQKARLSRGKGLEGADITQRVWQITQAQGLTSAAQIARKCRISPGHMAKVLGRNRSWTPTLIQRVAAGLDVDPDWLESGNHPMLVAEDVPAYGDDCLGQPLRYTLYRCSRCRGPIEEGARVCPHCAMSLCWCEFRQRTDDGVQVAS